MGHYAKGNILRSSFLSVLQTLFQPRFAIAAFRKPRLCFSRTIESRRNDLSQPTQSFSESSMRRLNTNYQFNIFLK
ncbi:MAG: hypothetical protein CRN43_22265 [Candidatus Nephrothrix sp. EaCA]|nr:MAG: hypothetical protein CRN43_22265 [Candidatus Nephrothrix sp. EaCA]